MSIEIIVSYDASEMDQDALALGQLLAGKEDSLTLAYVRHAKEEGDEREQIADEEAAELLDSGAAILGKPDVPRFIVFSASTPEGLSQLAKSEEASVIVFGSEYRTAAGHLEPQTSARRLVDGGRVAIAIAPACFRKHNGSKKVRVIGAITPEDDPCVRETADSLAKHLGARVETDPNISPDLLVIGSKIGTPHGVVAMSAAGLYLMGTVRCPVLVLPRGVTVEF
jgi:hypothetical protein